MVGMFAISKAGHDCGQMYLILKEEGEYVYLADGKCKGFENPKKKKKKHVQLVKSGTEPILTEKISKNLPIYNEEIRTAVRNRIRQEDADVKG